MSEIIGPIDYTKLKQKFAESLREELTSEILLSAVLRDSTGAELSSHIKSLDVLLSTRASEETLAEIRELLNTRASEETLAEIRELLSTRASESSEETLAEIRELLSTRASEETLAGIKAKTDQLTFDAAGRLAIQNPPNLDVSLSSRASEATLAGIKAQTDKLSFDTANRLAIQNPPNLDVALSSRASETTLAAIKAQTDKITFDAAGRLAIQNPPNLDVSLSSRASEATLAGLSGKFPSAVALTDNLGNPTTTIVGAANLGWDGTYWKRLVSDTAGRLRVSADVVANPPNLDVALSTRASEATLSAIRAQTDKLVFDTSSRLRINAEAVANPPNLDVALSSRASEATLSAFSGKFPSAVALADNLSNPTTTIIGSALLGFDGTRFRRVAVDTSSRLRVVAESVANPPNLDVSLSSRASEATLAGIKAQTDKLSFDTANRLAIQNPPNLDVALSSRASEATLSALNTEVTNNTWQKMRYGRVLSSLVWVYGSVASAPAAGTALASYSVPVGKTGFIYGYFISASEGNQFEIRWTSGGVARAIRIIAGGGTIHAASLIALNEGLAADPGTIVSIVNINAGGSGSIYQAGLFIGVI